MPKLLTIDRLQLKRSLCHDSFYDFVRIFWSSVIAEKPSWNWHIEIVCLEMQRMAERVFKEEPKEYDLIVNIPPGSTKSTVCSIMFPAWVWTRMPSARSICGSYIYSLAMDLSRKCRNVLRSELYRSLFPEIELCDDQDAKGYYANTKGGMRLCTATDGGVTGQHGHFIIVDDPLDPNRAASPVEVKSCKRWMNETLSQRKVNKRVTPLILIQQRLHQDDPTGDMLDQSKRNPEIKVRHVCLPAEVEDEPKPARLRRFYKGGLMDPVRLPPEVLAEAKVRLGEAGYAGQFRQKPIPPGGAMFKVERLVLDTPPQRFVACCRYWDKAGTSGAGAYTVGVKVGKDRSGRFWILDVVRGQWDSARREQVIKATAELDGRQVEVGVEQEPGSGGKESAENTVRMLAGWKVRVSRPTGDKTMRADPFSVQVNGGNVSVATAGWTTDYVEELKYFPLGKYKDQVDASSGAFSTITGPIRVGGVK